ncbi:MFS transporter [Metabacillus rhizolycopersici]|uniref:MFS transporter n=2 Tax=Metabacillus TaxID=2675233 RepID=A0ABS7UU09_9BACI|nr:MFS transporter [Metabacillus rhizolycopersici]MBZ5751631.1 MFS transporter [Metabacillus rhizolycopersici]
MPINGDENALLYDSLLQNGQEQTFEKYLGYLNVWDFTATIIAALCGSLLASQYGFELNYWISIVSILVSFCVSLMLVKPSDKNKFDKSIKIKEYIKASLHFFRKQPDICLVMLSEMVTGAALNFIDEFWQLYLNRLEIPILYFGLFSAVIMITRLPGNLLTHVMKNRFRNRTMLLGVTAIFAIGF